MSSKIKWASRTTWVGIVTLLAGLVAAVFDGETIRPIGDVFPLLFGGKVLAGLGMIVGRAALDTRTASR